jgi:rSAM-associated Gly-rich repeat protein
MRNPTLKALSILLPAGLLGASVTLAGGGADALPLSPQAAAAASGQNPGVAARLKAIRDGVSEVGMPIDDGVFARVGEGFPNVLKAWWRNFRNGGGWHRGFRNGGWGWRNGGFRPGWRNGGWRNFRNF